MTQSIAVRFLSTSLLLVAAASVGCQQEIISHNPESRAAGLKELNDGNYADAAGSFRNAIRVDPRDYKSQYCLGLCYEKMNQNQNAIQAYKTSLDAQTRTLAGQDDKEQKLKTVDALAACIAKSDNRDAELNVIEAQAKATNKPWDLLILAKAYQNRGDADSALDAYNRAALADPKDFIVMKEYGLYLEQLGQKPRASMTLRKAYTINPNDQQVNAALSRLNIVPGPGLKEESQLNKPPVPLGPLPEVDLSKFKIPAVGGSDSSANETPAPDALPAPSATPTAAPSASPAPAPAAASGSGFAPAANVTPATPPPTSAAPLPQVPRATAGPKD